MPTTRSPSWAIATCCDCSNERRSAVGRPAVVEVVGLEVGLGAYPVDAVERFPDRHGHAGSVSHRRLPFEAADAERAEIAGGGCRGRGRRCRPPGRAGRLRGDPRRPDRLRLLARRRLDADGPDLRHDALHRRDRARAATRAPPAPRSARRPRSGAPAPAGARGRPMPPAAVTAATITAPSLSATSGVAGAEPAPMPKAEGSGNRARRARARTSASRQASQTSRWRATGPPRRGRPMPAA